MELEPCELKYPADFEHEIIRAFTDSFRTSRGLTALQSDEEILVLRHLGVIHRGRFVPNVAAALLFATDPRSVIPGGRVRFLRFEGTEEGSGARFNATKDIWIEGPIPYLIVRTEQIVEAQVRDFTRLGKDGKFFTAPEYPKEAWYETIVNACVHRSYGLKNMSIFVKMFDDRLVVESPGGFPPLVTPQNIFDMHSPRNPHLMDALYYLQFVKCAHEGTRRMRDRMAAMNLPGPEFTQKEENVGHALVRVTLRNNIAHRKVFVDSDAVKLVGEAIFKDLTEHERLVINYLAENHEINVSQTQRLTARTWPMAKRLLSGLVKRGVLFETRRRNLERDPWARFRLKGSR